jgi:hypothetical protein
MKFVLIPFANNEPMQRSGIPYDRRFREETRYMVHVGYVVDLSGHDMRVLDQDWGPTVALAAGDLCCQCFCCSSDIAGTILTFFKRGV